MKVLGLNRVELLVNDPDAAQATFEKLFNGGCFAADSAVHGRPQDCRVNYPHGLELVHPMDTRYLPGQLLTARGEHIFCVVWDVDSIDAAREHVLAEGFSIRYEGDYSAKPEVEAARAQLGLARQAANAGPVDQLRARVAADPSDHQARFDLATALHAKGDVKGAVDELLDLFRRDRDWNDGAAKAQLFTIFDSLSPKDPLVLAGRRRLSSMIFA